jgi:7-cyano-7-deazaguanine synthase
VIDAALKAVVLLSGGLDSATAMAVAKGEGFQLFALTVNYGQRHSVELEAAKRVGQAAQVERHEFLNVDLRSFGGSALTESIDVPKDRQEAEMDLDIPITYVPARNTILLSLGLAFAETIGAYDLFCGVNAVDYSGYPDCRPEFLEAFEKTANLGTKAGIEGGRFSIHAPLVKLRKAEIIRLGMKLGVDYSLTHSCYDPDAAGRACGRCDSCLLRKKGFADAGVPDPTVYIR